MGYTINSVAAFAPILFKNNFFDKYIELPSSLVYTIMEREHERICSFLLWAVSVMSSLPSV